MHYSVSEFCGTVVNIVYTLHALHNIIAHIAFVSGIYNYIEALIEARIEIDVNPCMFSN